MRLKLSLSKIKQYSKITLTGSKSETNRLLLLQSLYPNITLENVSNSDDSKVMLKALSSNSKVIDIHHAGTAMRFLTAYYSIQDLHEVVITGSDRMQERPIAVLVDALTQLGADIQYVINNGFPPLKIKGKKLNHHSVSLPANVSSQYISALLLIAPKLEKGIELTLDGEITSESYIRMTLELLNKIGVKTLFEKNTITVKPQFKIKDIKITIESDWSSASYYYSIVALSPVRTKIELTNFFKNSLQGDSALVSIYKNFGVETTFTKSGIILEKINYYHQSVKLNLIDSPDIAQTIAVTSFGLGLGCRLDGLHTLKIKETDRLNALKIELKKLGAMIIVTDSVFILSPSTKINQNVSIDTYQDHRMAMAFAPLALKINLKINDAEVVSKSYPNFWEDLKSIGFKLKN